MQKKKPAPVGDDQAQTKRSLQQVFERKRVDPYKQVLRRKGFAGADRRIRYGQVHPSLPPFPPPCFDWDLHDASTLQTYALNEWKILNWFVELAKKGDLESLTAAELLGLQEDYLAFQARVIPILTPKGSGWNRTELPSLDELRRVQRTVREHIEAFFTTGAFTFTTFTPTLWIERDPQDRQRLIDQEFVPATDANGMVYLFASLLRRVRLPIERCPRCQNIFLKSRKDAGYCSRACQSLFYAQRQRGDRPPSKRGRPRKYPDPLSSNTKIRCPGSDQAVPASAITSRQVGKQHWGTAACPHCDKQCAVSLETKTIVEHLTRGRPRKNHGQQVSQDHKTVQKATAKKGATHGTKRR